jgi:hypothetical protein
MGKASRQRRQRGDRRRPAHPARQPTDTGVVSARVDAEAALARLLAGNAPGRLSLAGAYGFGFGALGLAQQEDDGPDWYHELDPVDTLFLGTAWPATFRDAAQFANARTAWLRLLRGTPHWPGIETFVGAVMAASTEHDLPVDDGQLMLLLAAGLETAGLDRRKLPASLLPGAALAGARFIDGPAADLVLPDPPPDAAERVARLWAGTQVGLRHDGTPVDALREGLHLLGNAGLPVRDEPALLLPALYAALVAGEHEPLADAADRAVAWALGLAETSPLLPVADVLLVAPERGMPVDAVLACLYAIPAFAQPVDPNDRRWHSSPGTDLPRLAFETGHQEITTLDGTTLRLGAGTTALLQGQVRRFEEKFGRPPGPDDPLFFDPDADEPRPVPVLHVEQTTVDMLTAAGTSPAWIYAYRNTGGLLPRPDGTFRTDRDRAEWNQAVDRYTHLHPDIAVDHHAELGKLRAAAVLITIPAAADDPAYAATLIDRLPTSRADSDDIDGDDEEIELLHAYLQASAGHLTATLREDPATRAAAVELARAAAGAQFADYVQHTAQSVESDEAVDTAVLLLTAAVLTRG